MYTKISYSTDISTVTHCPTRANLPCSTSLVLFLVA